jgi:hypothetical protein
MDYIPKNKFVKLREASTIVQSQRTLYAKTCPFRQYNGDKTGNAEREDTR